MSLSNHYVHISLNKNYVKATLKRCVFNWERNCVRHFAVLSDTGKLFQRVGDATEKHRSPCVTVREGGTDNRSVDDPDLSVLETVLLCNSCTK